MFLQQEEIYIYSTKWQHVKFETELVLEKVLLCINYRFPHYWCLGAASLLADLGSWCLYSSWAKIIMSGP